MVRAKKSLLILSVFVAAWVLIPAQASQADRVKTEFENNINGSDMDSSQTESEFRFNGERSEARQNALSGVEKKTEGKKTGVRTYRESDADLTPQ